MDKSRKFSKVGGHECGRSWRSVVIKMSSYENGRPWKGTSRVEAFLWKWTFSCEIYDSPLSLSSNRLLVQLQSSTFTKDRSLSSGLPIVHFRKTKIIFQRKFRSSSRSNSIFESDYGFNFDSNFQLYTLSTFCQGGFSKSCYLIGPFPMFWLAKNPLKCRLLRTPLQKITTGMFLASLAFVVSGTLQLFVEGKCMTHTYDS